MAGQDSPAPFAVYSHLAWHGAVPFCSTTTFTGKTGNARERVLGVHTGPGIVLERYLDVTGFLPAELGNPEGRVGVAIALDAVASKTGISDLLTGLGVSLGHGRLCEQGCCEQQRCRVGYDLHVRNHLVYRQFPCPCNSQGRRVRALW